MNPLQTRLTALRQRFRLVTFTRGLSLVLVLFLGGLMLAGLVDWLLNTWAVVRAFLLVSLIGGVGLLFYLLIWRPLRNKTDDLTLALKIEEEYPVLNDALASTIQMMQIPEDSPHAGSPSMRKETVQRAMRLAQGCDFNKTINSSWTVTSSVSAALTVLLFGLIFYLMPTVASSALMRLMHPFGEHEWPTATQIQLDFPKRLARGQTLPFVLKVKVTGEIPEEGTVEFNNLNSLNTPVHHYKIETDDDGNHSFKVDVNVTRQNKNFQFRVTVNDAKSPRGKEKWHTVEVLEPPHLDYLNGKESPQVVLHIPEYTGLDPVQELPSGIGNIYGAPAGTLVDFRAGTDRPIEKAWLEYRPASPFVPTGAKLGPIGHTGALQSLAVLVGGQQFYTDIPCRLDESGKQLSVKFRPCVKGAYALHIEDDKQLGNEYLYTLNTEADPVPEIEWVKPLSNKDVHEHFVLGFPEDPYRPFDLLPDAVLDLEFLVADQGIRSTYAEYWRLDKLDRPRDFQPIRLGLYDHDELERVSRHVLTTFAGIPTLPMVKTGLFLERRRQMQLKRQFSIKGKVKVGDSLLIRGCAHDFNDVVAHNVPGTTPTIRWKIVSEAVFAAKDDQAHKAIRNEIIRAKKDLNKAIKNINEVAQKQKEDGKLEFEDVLKLAEASELQDEINTRIGRKPEEGLQGALKRLLQKYKENNKVESSAHDRAEVLKSELKRIADNNLQKAEQLITEEKSAAENQELAKNSKKLDEAKNHQKDALETLEDMLKFLEPWAKNQEIKGELQSLLREQEALKTKTRKLLNDSMKNPDDDWKAKVNQTAQLQRWLADEAEKALKTMERVANEKKANDPKAAEKLTKAAKIGRDEKLPKMTQDPQIQMKRAALVPGMKKSSDQLRKESMGKALKTQEEVVDVLKEMIDALEDSRQDEIVERLEKQKKAQEKLNDVLNKLEKLRKKIDQAKQQHANDPAAQENALKDLADEQRDLEKEVEKKGRELAKLNAEEARKQMAKAAEAMNEAAKKLDGGQDPQEEQQQAEQELKKAEKALEQAENQLQEELLRQRLVKIKSKIEGLRDRQIGAVVETERIHTEVMKSGWDSIAEDALRVSLRSHQMVQKGLAAETKQLAEELKQAAVFELILKKAAQNMEQASEIMKDRIIKARNRITVPAEDRIDKDNPFLPKDFQEENQLQQATLSEQNLAKTRLEKLVKALDEEIAASKKRSEQAKEQKAGDEQNQPQEQQQNGIRPSDGIPELAQLKALRDEHVILNVETKKFHEDHPDPAEYTDREQTQVQQLFEHERELFRLFRGILERSNPGPNANANPNNPNPEQNPQPNPNRNPNPEPKQGVQQ